MHVRSKFVLVVGCAAAVVAVVVPTASAGAKTECNGTYSNQTLNGGVVVKQGDVCDLDNVTVNGGLTVNGGSYSLLAVNNSTINGGWSITGVVYPVGSNHGYFCGDNVNGGLNVIGTEAHGLPLLFGEADAGCAGGTINGGASFVNNHAAVELDTYTVNGGVTFSGNAGGFNEIEGTTVHGQASCQAGVTNDGDGGPNSYTGPNNGCPA